MRLWMGSVSPRLTGLIQSIVGKTQHHVNPQSAICVRRAALSAG
jgi:hypothetical protein